MIERYVRNLQQFLQDRHPTTLIILGSGLGNLAEHLSNVKAVSYPELEFPKSTVVGHSGQLLCGFLGQTEVLCMQGRFHLYEGYDPNVVKEIMCAFSKIGIKHLIVTNAAGSLSTDMPAGSLMLIRDHINFSGRNPLVGPNDENDGPRFIDMSNAYDRDLRARIKNIAKKHNIKLFEGIYLMVLGPNFETPAEIKAFQTLGADAVGMSTVPEVLAAVYAGLDVLGFSVITNLGTGLQTTAQSHEETLNAAQLTGDRLSDLITLYLEEKV